MDSKPIKIEQPAWLKSMREWCIKCDTARVSKGQNFKNYFST